MDWLSNRKDLTIFVILIGLSFSIIIGLSSPALYLTDEWITVNQLNQLQSGSQLLNTEGKFGQLFTGETSLYFTTRGNFLAYSLFLPVASLPALNLFLILGDSFRFGVLLIWGIITLISLLLVTNLLSTSGRKKSVHFCYFLIVAFIIFFFCNFLLYTPFSASLKDSPIESAAVIFTNEVLLALMVGILYLFYRNILITRRLSIAATIITMCCSSYLFWSSTAKDHMLIVFLLSCALFFCSELLVKRTNFSGFLLFVTFGLIAWTRPEIGFFILGGVVLWYLFQIIKTEPATLQKSAYSHYYSRLIPLSGLFIGLTPFFINNAIITGNPIIPTQLLYLQERGSNIGENISSNVATIVTSGSVHEQPLLLDKIILFFTPDFSSWVDDLFGIFFYPITGAAGIFFICPIIIIAVFSQILYTKPGFKKFNQIEKQVFQFCLLLTIIIFLSLVRNLHGLNTSMGIYPDIRYLSPLYLFMSVISILLIQKADLLSERILLRFLIISTAVIPFVLIIGMVLTEPFGGLLIGQYQLLWVLTYILVIASCILMTLPIKNSLKKTHFSLMITLVAIIPLTWQIMLISLYAVVKMNGYPYWIPFAEFIVNTFLKSVN